MLAAAALIAVCVLADPAEDAPARRAFSITLGVATTLPPAQSLPAESPTLPPGVAITPAVFDPKGPHPFLPNSAASAEAAAPLWAPVTITSTTKVAPSGLLQAAMQSAAYGVSGVQSAVGQAEKTVQHLVGGAPKSTAAIEYVKAAPAAPEPAAPAAPITTTMVVNSSALIKAASSQAKMSLEKAQQAKKALEAQLAKVKTQLRKKGATVKNDPGYGRLFATLVANNLQSMLGSKGRLMVLCLGCGVLVAAVAGLLVMVVARIGTVNRQVEPSPVNQHALE